jgi:hypothetical protein
MMTYLASILLQKKIYAFSDHFLLPLNQEMISVPFPANKNGLNPNGKSSFSPDAQKTRE